MKVTELATLLGIGIEIRWYPLWNDGKGEWGASLVDNGGDVEYKEGCLLTSPCCGGDTPTAALQAMTREIAGKRLVLSPTSPSERREFTVPRLEAE